MKTNKAGVGGGGDGHEGVNWEFLLLLIHSSSSGSTGKMAAAIT